METNSPSRNLIKYYNELYRDFPDKFSKAIYIDFNHSIKSLLGHYKNQDFNFSVIESQKILDERSEIKNLKIHSFINNIIEFEVDFVITFYYKLSESDFRGSGDKVVVLKPILNLEIKDNVWENRMALKNINYPIIDQSF